MHITKLFSSNSMSEQLANKLPPYTLRCHINNMLGQGKAKEVLEFIKKYMSEFNEKCRPGVRSAILSL